MPERTCVGCRTKRPQSQLVRLALTEDGQPVVSRTANGRGAWLCVTKTPCIGQAIKRRGFERAWKRPIPASTHQAIEIAVSALALSDMKINMDN